MVRAIVRRGRGRSLACGELLPLGGDPPAESPKIFRVTSEQPSWFLKQAEDPLDSAALHPARRAFHPAGDEIHGRADPNGHWHAERSIVHGHPFFLLGTTEAYQENVRLRFADTPVDFVVVHLQERLKSRRIELD